MIFSITHSDPKLVNANPYAVLAYVNQQRQMAALRQILARQRELAAQMANKTREIAGQGQAIAKGIQGKISLLFANEFTSRLVRQVIDVKIIDN